MDNIISDANLILYILELTANTDPTGSLLWKFSLCSTAFSRSFILPLKMTQFRSSLRSKYIVKTEKILSFTAKIISYTLNNKLHQEYDLPAYIQIFNKKNMIEYWLQHDKFHRNNNKPIIETYYDYKFWIDCTVPSIFLVSPIYEYICSDLEYCYYNNKRYKLTRKSPI